MFIFHTADVVWDEIEVCIDRLETVDELMTSLSTAMNECRREEEGTLLTVVFTGQGSLSLICVTKSAWKRFFTF